MSTSNQSTGEPATPAGRSWRRHSAEFKARVIELARQPGVSTAAVALANGLNANMLRRWVREAGECAPVGAHKDTAAAGPAFVQLPMPHEAPPAVPPVPTLSPRCIAVEIRRGSTTVQAELPLDARSAAWLREVLG
ncbi:transposase [Pseudomonas aeruginosa]|uniref:IS66-like element accessory protein TnpA n=1 Tax=Pseudomonas TaxID=286 RepID=UPI001C84C950|nr:transposase [Pseudomonas aeruginosa]MBX6553014.1 transposase [Pseudomonas aeruginosa]MBX6585468.1 transposase [Pseudomonas aeruginosa]MBX6602367.1 transposase [Pseudomonas aeruginosa]MBX6615606.1 transposase [Pseudomonas aeruginosa]MBX6878513.1 transposase [Pseudomonas aeruginosa]